MNEIDEIIEYLEKKYTVHNYTNDPFRVLISCVLSQRTKDEITEKVSSDLFKVADTPIEISKLDTERLQRIIKPIGFYRKKAKVLKEISKLMIDKEVPDNVEDLIKLPGVGRKTANVVLAYGFNKDAIPVDTHVNRISKRLGLVDKKASVYDVEKKLESLFPKKKWRIVNRGFVNFGKTVCKPIGPRCSVCPFNAFCKFYKESKL